jgi:diguanylate cyclase (GGDEF)-like protein/PAS domain S-box-containing protein
MAERKWHLVGRLFGRTAEAIMITDARSRIIYVNQSFTKVTGYTLKDVAGKTPRILHSGRQSPEYYARMWKALQASGRWVGEIWNRRKNGEIYPEWLSISAVRSAREEVENYLAIFSDITLRKREERELYDLATHDALTGLPNRSFFNEQFRQAMARAKRSGRLAGLLYLDLDRFKPVNDLLGHESGDKLLQTVARRLRRLVREEDTIARLGGDEFAVILEHLSRPRDAAPTAKKILRALTRPFLLGGHRASVTASVGIVVYPVDGDSVETLLRRADRAMYRAKKGGGNEYRFRGDPSRAQARGAGTDLEQVPPRKKAVARPRRRLPKLPAPGRSALPGRGRRGTAPAQA